MDYDKIKDYINSFFPNETLTSGQNSLRNNLISELNEKILDKMNQGIDFNEAFIISKKELGDINKQIEIIKTLGSENTQNNYNNNKSFVNLEKNKKGYVLNYSGKIMMSVICFLFLGMVFNQWTYSWILIPVTAICCSSMNSRAKIVSLSPFVFIMLGFLFNLWSIAWIIIPLSAILLFGLKKVD